MRRHTTKLDLATLERVMRVNFLAPAHMALTVLPRHDREGRRHDRERLECGRTTRKRQRSRLLGQQVRSLRLERSDAVDLFDSGIVIRLVNPGPIDTEIWDLPDNDDPIYSGTEDLRPRKWPRES